MSSTAPFAYPLVTTAAGGIGSVTITVPINERWHVGLVTATSTRYTVTVTRNGATVDSTNNDPRPTVTSDSGYDLEPGEQLAVSWAASGGVTIPDGTALTATVTGTRTIG